MSTNPDQKQSQWNNDVLSRDVVAKDLVKYLKSKYSDDEDVIYQESFVLNLNAEWGHGKTHFLLNLSEDLIAESHPVIYYDAWKNDFTSNPLVGFISTITKALIDFKTKHKPAASAANKVIEMGKEVLGLSFAVGVNFALDKIGIEKSWLEGNLATEKSIKILEKNHFSNLVNEHESIIQAIEKFKEALRNFILKIEEIKNSSPPLFILVDELDRCRPNYAIELLENIKHIFNVKGVIFIVASNTKELCHSIKGLYGSGFDASNYLRRFFDVEYKFPAPNLLDFSKHLVTKYRLFDKNRFYIPLHKSSDDIASFIAIMSGHFELGLRDIEQIINRVKSTVLVTDFEKIHIVYLIAVSIVYFKNGNSFPPDYDNGKALSGLKTTFGIRRYTEDYYRKEENVTYSTIFAAYSALSNHNYRKIRELSHNISLTALISEEVLNEKESQSNDHYFSSLHYYPQLVIQAGHYYT